MHKGMDFVTQPCPQGVRQTALTILAVLAAAAYGGINTLTDGSNDLCNGYILRCMCQPVTTTWPTQAFNQTTLFQADKQLLQVGQRNTLSLGDTRQCHRALVIVDREIQHGSHCITPFC